MRSTLSAGFVPVMLVALAATMARPAAAVTITAGTAAGVYAGQTVDVNVTTDDLTGLGIYSYQFTMTFNSIYVSLTDVIEAGTLTGNAGWGDATFNAGTGTVTVSHAGATALTGSGTLLTLRFLVNPAALSGGYTALSWQSFLFNEGSPAPTKVAGSITISATPTISVSPNTGEVLVGENLAFSVGGSVTNPVTWGTTDGSVATISPTGVLTGVAPGAVRVFAVDAASRRDTTNGDIVVRAARVTVGSGGAYQGQSVTVPVTVTDLTGLGVRSGQVRVSFNANLLTATGVTTSGTLLDGYGPALFGTTPGNLVVDFAGATDLAGSGVLCNLNFDATPLYSGSTILTLTEALFNEEPAIRANGLFTVNSLPTIAVTPDNVTLLAGQTQQFLAGGSPVLPITWSTLDPAVATIDPSGLLTAQAGGVTRVQATDDIGATDLNTAVTVYDFRVWPDTVEAAPGDTVTVLLRLDRSVAGLGVYSTQYTVAYNPMWITGTGVSSTGVMSAWGAPAVNPQNGQLIVAGAGSSPLGAGTTLHAVRFAVSPSAPLGTNVPFTLSPFMCNEGTPSAQTGPGMIKIVANVGVPAPTARGGLWLASVRPNPARGNAHFAFSLPGPGATRVRLAVYSASGRRVHTLVEGSLEPGLHQVEWNLHDRSGHGVAPGLYFTVLEWDGGRLTQKFATVR